jgi:hypothetical protein
VYNFTPKSKTKQRKKKNEKKKKKKKTIPSKRGKNKQKTKKIRNDEISPTKIHPVHKNDLSTTQPHTESNQNK